MMATWIDGADRPVVVEMTKAEADKLALICRDLADTDANLEADLTMTALADLLEGVQA